jgi:hypothetical protein
MRLLVERFPVRYLVVSSGRTPGLWPLVAALEDSRLFSLVAEAEDGDRLYERRQEAHSPTPPRDSARSSSSGEISNTR